MSDTNAKFHIGQLVRHLKVGYRGVIFDVDPVFAESEEWYEAVAVSRPPKDKPWYRVLVHGAGHTTYVAERHLEPDPSGQPVDHPLTERLFDGISGGSYRLRRTVN